jgi:Lrp/AsnC family leucine-responsive transcriptional regulator
MDNIDQKDRKILYELDLNCRQSNTQIGKKVGLKRDVVGYRINRMLNQGIIENFWTAINTFKLGYLVFRIYINFQYVNREIKNEIISHFTKYKKIWTILSVRADIDFDVVVWVNDVYEFYCFWDETLDKFKDYFAEYTISIYVESYDYKKTYLLTENSNHEKRELYRTTCGGKTIDIDDFDYKLLNEIADNARIPLIDLAEKLNCSSQTVNYRLKNLFKNNIIQGYRVNLNLAKLGLHQYKLEIYLKDHNYRGKVWNYLKNEPYTSVLNVAVGWSDLEFEFVLENVDILTSIMDEINIKFPNVIKKQSFWINEQIHKFRWLPEI